MELHLEIFEFKKLVGGNADSDLYLIFALIFLGSQIFINEI